MADQSFPQIPSTVWWGTRTLLQKTPSAKFDETMISASLGVQAAASRQYLAELKRVGVLDEEGRATELGKRWRLDETYEDAVKSIASGCYPESLITIAPPGSSDRQTVVNWFMHQGLGEGSAKNKASTYILLTASEPNTSAPAPAKTDAVTSSGAPRKDAPTRRAPTARTKARSKDSRADGVPNASPESMPLNVNVQIHISADASSDQIDSIFRSMREHLYDKGDS